MSVDNMDAVRPQNGQGANINNGDLVSKDPNVGAEVKNPEGIKGGKNEYADIKTKTRTYTVDAYNSILKVNTPEWSYLDWIRERTEFQKCLACGTDEMGWFYFKVFFDFQNGGLLGGVLTDTPGEDDEVIYKSQAMSAYRYLMWNSGLYRKEKLSNRVNALVRFIKLLNDIVANRPYLITSIKNLNTSFNIDLKEINKEKTIEIGFMQDGLNMDIGKLFDLYRYVTYDNLNCKEILPDNTRKFDMTICLFSSPIRYVHTGIKSRSKGTIDYKSMRPNGDDFSNMMSYKMITFKNCEFDLESLGEYYGSELKNETAFNLAGSSIKIKYDKAIHHRMDEWNQMFFGDTGVVYDYKGGLNQKKQEQEARVNALIQAIGNNKLDTNNIGQYKELIDATELLIQYNAIMVNHVPQYVTDYYHTHKNDFMTKFKAIKDGTIKGRLQAYYLGPGSKYFNEKIKILHSGVPGANGMGNIYDWTYGPGSAYFKKKLELMKDGKVNPINVAGQFHSLAELTQDNVKNFQRNSNRNYLNQFLEECRVSDLEYTDFGIAKVNRFMKQVKEFSASSFMERGLNSVSSKVFNATGGILAF